MLSPKDSKNWLLPPVSFTSLWVLPTSSIIQLLHTNQHLPSIDASKAAKTHPFPYSSRIPTDNHDVLRARSVPPVQTLLILKDGLAGAAGSGSRSFLDPRFSDEPTPLWMVTYWMQVTQALQVREDWKLSYRWLEEARGHQDPTVSQLATQALQTLTHLPWNSKVDGAHGAVGRDLAAVLSDSWLSTTVIKSLMQIVAHRLAADPTLRETIEVHDLTVYETLRKCTVEWDQYETARCFTALRALASRLEHPSHRLKLVFLPWNINDNHWVVYCLDVEAREVRYGDSLKREPLTADMLAIQKWLRLANLGLWEWGDDLASGSQMDSHSCGIAMANIIQHACFGDALWSPSTASLCRLRAYLQLVKNYMVHTLATVAPTIIVAAVADTIHIDPQQYSTGLSSQTSSPSMPGWKVVTKGEHAENMRREHDRDREADAEAARQEAVTAERVMLEKREGARLRKAAERKRKRAAERRAGLRDAQGKRIPPKTVKTLQTHDTSKANTLVSFASHPRQLLATEVSTNQKPQGRKRKHVEDAPKGIPKSNWLHPLLFSQIVSAALRTGHPLNAACITRTLKQRNFTDFGQLRQQVIGRYIDPDTRGWKASVLLRVQRFTEKAPSNRTGILAQRPDVVDAVISELKSFRAGGLSVLLPTARAVMLAHIQTSAPELLVEGPTGRTFHCSDSFMRKFLGKEMGWSLRKATRAAQKTPTNIQLQSPARLTYEKIGAKQVALLGAEEKRAFTVLVGVAASGAVLPFQSIWHGKSNRSCPSKDAAQRAEADELGFRFEPSKTSTYWSTFALMKSYVGDILVPYLEGQKMKLGLPPAQRSLLQLDVWVVHRGTEFRTWLTETHPAIIRDFVPAGCTGIFQPCDTGIQRPLKQAIRQAQQEDLIVEARKAIEENRRRTKNGQDPVPFKFDIRLGVLRDRSVRWLLEVYKAIDNPALVKKAFEICRVGDDAALNLSQESLQSTHAQALVADLQAQDPAKWVQSSLNTITDSIVDDLPQPTEPASPFDNDPEYIDDVTVPVDRVVACGMASSTSHAAEFRVDQWGDIEACSPLEDPEYERPGGPSLWEEHQVESVVDQLQVQKARDGSTAVQGGVGHTRRGGSFDDADSASISALTSPDLEVHATSRPRTKKVKLYY
ncbi:hypothetical protein TRAPUB_11400 [Trametes pubescens]|uniref:Ubiquitin-like protease family profile domain-containing protein n=1 Tax=Trametes pubescens TaxID=154538 RepID=A0A1M2VX10_TRAPU|nr:hypothetical protein TRAPUB_11400 [Trametes pubescens]